MALTKAVELSQIAGTLTSDSSGNTTLTGSVTASSFITGGTALLDSSRADSAYVRARADSDYVKSVRYGDNEVLYLGNSSDLRLFHNGFHSILREAGTGRLYLQSDDDVRIASVTGTEDMAKFVANGAVELYHNNVKKFQTTADGIKIFSDDSDNSVEPFVSLIRNSGTPADNDPLGTIVFKGQNDADQEFEYARIVSKALDISDGTEDGGLIFQVATGGTTSQNRLSLQGYGDTVFSNKNVRLDNVNLKFEGSTSDAFETSLTVVDPTADRTITFPDATGTVALTSDVKDSAFVTGIIDSSYIQARDRYRDSNFVTALVDSAYIQLRDRFQDSAGITAIIDSAYVTARAPGADGDGLAFAIALG